MTRSAIQTRPRKQSNALLRVIDGCEGRIQSVNQKTFRVFGEKDQGATLRAFLAAYNSSLMTMPRSNKLLILDLDETLIFGTKQPLDRPSDFVVGDHHVYLRPHVAEFVAHVLDWFRCAVWTSASRPYAEGIVSHLFPRGDLHFLWAVERCTNHRRLEYGESVWLKDLNKVRRRGEALASVIAVDDSPEKFARSYGNLIRVQPFEGDLGDNELPLLARYLERLAPIPDVRAIEKRMWRDEFQDGGHGGPA